MQPRVAFFPDSFLEVNGVARTARAIVDYAERHDLPLMCVHGGRRTRRVETDSVTRLELKRGPVGFAIEHDMRFDLLFWRHGPAVADALRAFRPDVIHITGPADVGQLGAWLGYRLRIPIVGSWHTNLHEFAARRVREKVWWLPPPARTRLTSATERQVLNAVMQFYRIPRALLAPNEDLVRQLAARTGKRPALMLRGVDTLLFTPARRTRPDEGEVHIGFVGRLSAEKGVRALLEVEQALLAGNVPFRLVVVGDGAEREWLRRHLTRADFPGLLEGEALARAYADMDIFVFPSETDTFGNVVLEAMASGVPVVALARGGPRFTVKDGTSGVLAGDAHELAAATLALARDRARLQQMRRAARAQAEICSWDAIGDSLYSVYANAA